MISRLRPVIFTASLNALSSNAFTYPTPTVESTIGVSNAFAVFASRRTCISTRSALVSERMTSNISFW